MAAADGLKVKPWFELSEARRSNVLRAWLKQRLGMAATSSLVARLMTELRPAGAARWPLPTGELRVYRGVLRHVVADDRARAGAVREQTLTVRRAGDFRLPGWGGCLRVTRSKEAGVPLAWLGHLEVKPRQGAERFQAGLGRPPRSLKKQYQAAGVPEWDRLGPLFYSGGQLVFVPGLGLDARVWALPGQAQVTLEWVPHERAA